MNLFFTDMVIGFTQRIRTVSESDAPEGEDIFTIRASVDALCRDGPGLISRERVQRGRLTRQGTRS